MQSKLLVALFAALALTACQKAEEASAPAMEQAQEAAGEAMPPPMRAKLPKPQAKLPTQRAKPPPQPARLPDALPPRRQPTLHRMWPMKPRKPRSKPSVIGSANGQVFLAVFVCGNAVPIRPCSTTTQTLLQGDGKPFRFLGASPEPLQLHYSHSPAQSCASLPAC
jgi:hypothetical protein